MGTVPFEYRYSVINEKNPREIVLLRGVGCQWRKCRFCDYHLDFCKDTRENYELNRRVLEQVTGEYHCLEVINSGSFSDLDEETMNCILSTCLHHEIDTLYFEAHWMHREEIPALKEHFSAHGITLKTKIGVETFDALFRECYLRKGIDAKNPAEIAEYFNQVCLLQGIPGQTAQSMQQDIEIGLTFFDRVCVNIMVENTTAILPDPNVIEEFMKEVYPIYRENDRVDILLNNTDFGVGV